MDLRSSPIGRGLKGVYRPPSDKSISHRLALLGALTPGTTIVHSYLDSADTIATAKAMEAMGARVDWALGEYGWSLTIHGGQLKPPSQPLDFQNSGTGMRLGAGLLSGLGVQRGLAGQVIELIGDQSLSKRPMERIVTPLKAQGADICSTDGHAPLVVRPSLLSGHAHQLTVASAQIKSAILLAGLNAEGVTSVAEPAPSRDHTERLFEAFGVTIERASPLEVSLVGGQQPSPGQHTVPGDLSSAAFIMAASLLVPNSEVLVRSVGLNPSRSGLLQIIEAMQGSWEAQATTSVGAEPVGDLFIQSQALKGAVIPPQWVPLAIDEFPIVMGMAAAAEGETLISGASELRVKESDRLALMCSELQKLGVELEEHETGARILGGDIQGGTVESDGDHRIAMTFAVLGLIATAPIVIRDAEWMQTSYPRFVEDMNALGAKMEWL
jgi:3-phosphoshikimate 1-carboxyvinyltransferase